MPWFPTRTRSSIITCPGCGTRTHGTELWPQFPEHTSDECIGAASPAATKGRRSTGACPGEWLGTGRCRILSRYI